MTWSDYLVEAIEPWLLRQWMFDYVDEVLSGATGYIREPVVEVQLPGHVHTITITGRISR